MVRRPGVICYNDSDKKHAVIEYGDRTYRLCASDMDPNAMEWQTIKEISESKPGYLCEDCISEVIIEW